MAAPGVWGEEFLVNAVTSSAQLTPVIAALDGGRFAIAYTDFSRSVRPGFSDYSDSAIRVQVFGADGSALGEVVQVNTATSYRQDSPRIAPLADGGFVVTYADLSTGWNSGGDDPWDEAVRLQRFDADGAKLGAETLVNTSIMASQDYPSVALLADGRFVVAWDDGFPGDEVDINAQVFNADGSFAGEEFGLNVLRPGQQLGTDVAGLPGGGFVATWVDAEARDGDLAAIMARLFAPDGTPLTAEIQVNTAATGDQFQQSVTALAGGGFFVAWTDNSRGVDTGGDDSSHYAIRGQVFDAAGGRVGTEFRVNQVTTYGQSQPDVLALADGRFVVAYSDTSSGTETGGDDLEYGAIRARVFHPDGSPDGEEFLVNVTTQGHQNEPQLAQLPDGRIVFAWTDYSYGIATGGDDASNGAIRARILDLRDTACAWEGDDEDEDYLGTGWDDTLDGNSGDDRLTGGAGDDRLLGRRGNDVLIGDDGDDVLKGDGANDRLHGGAGADFMVGGSGNDRLFGDDGEDLMKGDRGNDVIEGGGGRDKITGGAGADVFVFTEASDSGRVWTQRDEIYDFEEGVDRIDLSEIDADPATAGDDGFVFLDHGDFTGVAGQVRYTHGSTKSLVKIDVDGDGGADMVIKLTGFHVLTGEDFIL